MKADKWICGFMDEWIYVNLRFANPIIQLSIPPAPRLPLDATHETILTT
jgi:hypothetical protein